MTGAAFGGAKNYCKMFLYIICGATRQGKSRYAKSLITNPKLINNPCLVYDFQNEYGNEHFTMLGNNRAMVKGPGLPIYRPDLKRCRFALEQGDDQDFIKIANACRGRTIIFEEATIFLKGGMKGGIRQIVVSRFHTNNNLVFVFHRLETVPKDILNLADYVILFKTADNPKLIHGRYQLDELDIAMGLQQKKKDGSAPTIVALKKNTIDGKPVNYYVTSKNNPLF